MNTELTQFSTRRVFVLSYPRSGADLLLDALRRIDGIGCVAQSNVALGMASLMRTSSRAELPGLHWLADVHQRRQITRQLANGILSLLSRGHDVVFEYSYGNITYLPLLQTLYPDASYIHVTSRPVTALTGREAWRRKRTHSVLRLCSDWAGIQRAVLASVVAAKHLTVHYEDLVAEPAEALRSIAALVGIQLRVTDIAAFAEAVGAAPKPLDRAVARRLLRWAIDTYTREECSLLGYEVAAARGRLQYLTASFILGCVWVSGSKGRAAWRN